MREAINENRIVQLALLGMLLLGAAMMFMKATKGDQGKSTAGSAASSPAGATAGTGTTSMPPATDATAAADAGATVGTVSGDPMAGSSAALAAAPRVPVEMVPGPGLPKSLLASNRRGRAIVLLVVRSGATDDRLVRRTVAALDSGSSPDVYVTRAKHIARYSSLTQGLDVSQLPALIVVRPGGGDGAATGTVSYGYRNSAGVRQAVKDALYRGPVASYHP
jgi:hypothetical protein